MCLIQNIIDKYCQLLVSLLIRWTVNEVSDMTAAGQQRAIAGKHSQDFHTSL